MTGSRVFISFVSLVLVTALPGCSRRPAAAPASAETPAEAKVVAEVEGQPITLAEVDDRARAQLASVRQQEYEARRDALDEIIGERLAAAEAKKRGISVDELLKREVADRAEAPPEGLAESILARNLDRFSGMPKEKALARIQDLLNQRAQSERKAEFDHEIREGKAIDVRLEPPRAEVSIPAGAPTKGRADAPVTIVEFTDYQCPFCHRAQSTIDELLSRYADQVRFVHLDFPLGSHPGAIPAARAARCAGAQGHFWEYHENLMTKPGSLDVADLERRAKELHLDPLAFRTCVSTDAHDDAIRRDLEQGEALGVSGTPAYFVNGRMISGARPLQTFTEAIDAELGR
jgi:protein-disulfide isomerase